MTKESFKKYAKEFLTWCFIFCGVIISFTLMATMDFELAFYNGLEAFTMVCCFYIIVILISRIDRMF